MNNILYSKSRQLLIQCPVAKPVMLHHRLLTVTCQSRKHQILIHFRFLKILYLPEHISIVQYCNHLILT